MRYWSMFFPDPVWRAQFAKQAIERRQALDVILAKHGLEDEFDIEAKVC